METVKLYVKGLSNEELFKEYVGPYRDWQKAGVLQDGVIRNIETKLNAVDDSLHIHLAERMFIEEFSKRFAAMMIMIDIKIDKYKGIIETLRENQSQEIQGDTYDYKTDLKNTAQFIRDLKRIRI